MTSAGRRPRCRRWTDTCSCSGGRDGPVLLFGPPLERGRVQAVAGGVEGACVAWRGSLRSRRTSARRRRDRSRPIVFILPILLTGILFGLAMGYEVFVTRMREAYVHDTPARQAVRNGFKHSVRAVTAAALIMVGIFTCNIFTDDVIPKTIGFRRPRQSAPPSTSNRTSLCAATRASRRRTGHGLASRYHRAGLPQGTAVRLIARHRVEPFDRHRNHGRSSTGYASICWRFQSDAFVPGRVTGRATTEGSISDGIPANSRCRSPLCGGRCRVRGLGRRGRGHSHLHRCPAVLHGCYGWKRTP
ncbi:MMPL family transporter [Streptomyces justiciae]|uniref:MMPL family transporter n=1 Tax=Streptomyces justiciae TaxID=2780140 RepID=A0ABU3LW25_9ACTN|nr:MMPL family transporter [Streptomyces justiciae]MDT7843370.1 MMPL family transporter [Streptomyces justiciae]